MSDDTRTRGVELGPLADDLESESYPMETAEVIDEYGDRDLELQEGDATVRDLLEPQGETTYDSAREVKQSLLNMVGTDALGRDGYSDRGVGTRGEEEDESF